MSTKAPIGLSGKTALILYGILGAIAMSTITPILPQIDQEFATADNAVMVKMVVTALGLGMLFGAPIGGILADRVGRKPVLLWSSILYAVAGGAAYLSGDLFGLIAARFVVGLALGALGTTMIAVIGDHWDAAGRNRWIGLTASLGTFSILAIGPVAGMMGDFAWRNVFLVYNFGLITAFFIWIGFPDQARSEVKAGLVQTATERTPFPYRILVLGFIAGGITTGTGLYLPFRFHELGITSVTAVTYGMLPGIVITALAALGYGLVRRKFSLQATFIIASAVCSAGLALMAIAWTPLLVTLGMTVEGVGIGLMMPNLSVYAITKATEANRARVIGAMKGAVFGGPFLIQFMLEPLSQMGGAPFALLGLSVAGAAVALIFLGMSMRKSSLAAA